MKNIGIAPSHKGALANKIFEVKEDRDSIREPWLRLKKRIEDSGGNLATADVVLSEQWKSLDALICLRPDFTFLYILKIIKRFPDVKLIFVQTEEEAVTKFCSPRYFLFRNLYDVCLSWRTDIPLDRRLIHQFYVNPRRTYNVGNSWDKSVLLIASNKLKESLKSGFIYPLRLEYIELLRKYFDRCHIAGYGWDKPVLNGVEYIGEVENKQEVYMGYTFALIIENSAESGGISEKIFDAMSGGCIPLYMGAPDVLDFIPEGCFINLREISRNSLAEKIDKLSLDEIKSYRNNIREFLTSQRYSLFTTEEFIENLEKAIAFKRSTQNRKVISYVCDSLFGAGLKTAFSSKRYCLTILKSFFL